MIGYSLMHGPGIFLLLALWAGLIWLLVVFIYFAWKRTFGGRSIWFLIAVYAVSWVIIEIPDFVWQRIFVAKLVESPHRNEYIQGAAARGSLSLVQALVDHGISVNAQDREGTTALHAAAVEGQVEVTRYLISKGANVNVIDRFGDSPLYEAETSNAEPSKKEGVKAQLVAHGALSIRATDEQRDKAAEEMVREDMKNMGQ